MIRKFSNVIKKTTTLLLISTIAISNLPLQMVYSDDAISVQNRAKTSENASGNIISGDANGSTTPGDAEEDTLVPISFENAAPEIVFLEDYEFQNILKDEEPDKGNVEYKIIEQKDFEGKDSSSIAEINSVTGMVTIKGAGTVTVCAAKLLENDEPVTAEYTLKINKGTREIKFSSETWNQFPVDSETGIATAVYRTTPYELSIVDKDDNEVTVSYRVENNNRAEITADNKLVLKSGNGRIKIIAKYEGDSNYVEETAELTLDLEKAEQKLEEVCSGLNAKKVSEDADGNIVQTGNGIVGVSYPLNIDSSKGKWIIEGARGEFSYDQIFQKICLKKAGTSNIRLKRAANNCYLESNTVELRLLIDYEETPSNPYKISKDCPETGWYREDIEIVPAEGYLISDTCSVDAKWSDTYQLPNANTEDKVIYLRKKDTGGITSAITVPAEEILIDKTAPVVEVTYDTNTPIKDNIYASPRTATIRITERNFRPEDVNITVFQALDNQGNPIAGYDQKAVKNRLKTWSAWTKVSEEGNSDEVWEAKIQYNTDAHYRFEIEYIDIAGNKAADSCAADFYVDCSAPTADSLKITYSTPLFEKILGAITFGYYKPSVTVTLQADDKVSGVESFTWNYHKENGASSVNALTEGNVIPASSNTGYTSTATFTLTAEEAKQYRGSISFTATDKAGNTSSLALDGGTTLVIDTISPTCKVTYNEPVQILKNKNKTVKYYSNNVTAEISITEANFYAEDVEIKVNDEVAALAGSWKQSGDTWTNTLTLKEDGEYQITIAYKDLSQNQMQTYTSDTLIVDKTKPKVSVKYTNKKPVQTVDGRTYYDAEQKAVLTITEHNFRAEDVEVNVTAADVAGNAVSVSDYNNYLKNSANWKKDGDKYTAEICFQKDANYTFDIDYSDLAMQKINKYKTDKFTVDKSKPENLTISYSVNVFEQVLERITFGYYNAKATVTISAEDMTTPIETFNYSYLKANGVSDINRELVEATIKENEITYSAKNGKAAAKFEVLKDALDSQNQFNGTVSFTAKDYAGNETVLEDDRRLVVDTIAPTAEITYNTPISSENGVAYYAGSVNAQILVNEANFDTQDVKVNVTKDGKAYAAAPAWRDNSTDTHTGSLTMAEDGDYVITVNYEDKSTNAMQEYVSEQMTIDTQIKEPVITINGQDANGMSYQNEAVLEIQFEDTNLADYQITLTRTTISGANEDVTEQFITDMTVSEQGGKGTFDTFENIQENDGIYHLTVAMSDKAGNEVTSEAIFTLNRFGSVYVYSNELLALQNQYIPSVEDDFIITEYNPNALLEDSIQINITCDGKALESPDVEVKEIENDLAQSGKGWHQYQYRISAGNFAADGVYKIAVSSKDAVGNTPENAGSEEQEIQFWVDSHAPEITSISGLDKTVVNAQSVQITYDVFDGIGLKDIKVFVDNEVVEHITDFSKDSNSYTGAFVIEESNASREVRIVAEDKAGNITDTSSEAFTSAYAFHPEITVSTNAFIRWYANKPLMYACIAGIVGMVALVTIIIYFCKKRKRHQRLKNSL